MSILPDTRFFSIKRHLFRACNVAVGDKCRIAGGVRLYGRGNVTFGVDAWIGLNTHIYMSPGSSVYIGSFCDIAPEVVFHTGTHEFGSDLRRAGAGKSDDIHVGDGTWVGVGAVILPGARIGTGCFVAAGSVVKKGLYPNNVMLAGVPAAVVREL